MRANVQLPHLIDPASIPVLPRPPTTSSQKSMFPTAHGDRASADLLHPSAKQCARLVPTIHLRAPAAKERPTSAE